MADVVFTSPYYERLEAALARHEAAGHVASSALTALAPRVIPGDEQTDPAAQLAAMLDQATSQLRPVKSRRARVAGLIATPAEPVTDDMHAALVERQNLIETAAEQLVREAQDARAAWIARLGKPRPEPRARAQWRTHATTVGLYRHRCDLGGPSPLGEAKSILAGEQVVEFRAAQVALNQLRRLSDPTTEGDPRRSAAQIARHRRL